MSGFFLQANNGLWLTTSNDYGYLTSDIDNRLQMYDYTGTNGYPYIGAPGWQWGNLINDYVLDQWGDNQYWTDNSFFQKGTPVTYINNQICQYQDNGKILSLRSDNGNWVFWSFTANDKNTVYLTWTKVSVSSEQAKKLAAIHPSARAPVKAPVVERVAVTD